MIKLYNGGAYLINGKEIETESNVPKEEARQNTIAYRILEAHNKSENMEALQLKFDALASHDITYVGIVQTARASGLERFPIPYVLTNCHNSLCAVGGTINEDDHVFGLSAARRYGGIYVPAHQAVIHSYMRETMSGCGKMILGSDSHTRYGALGTLAVGEGGPELVKQLLGRTYDINRPEVVGVYLTGKPKNGVGPQDVALAIIGAVFSCGYVKNKIMEFVGEGIASLPIEYRNGIDVMTTETTCLSSIWVTDDITKAYFETHRRADEYKKLAPAKTAYYDGMITVELDKIECMIALPSHPSNVFKIRDLDKTVAGQGIIAGCAGGTYDNLCAAANIMKGKSTGNGEFSLSVYPASQPVMSALMKNGAATDLIDAGATLRSAFCGPCFGAGDVPANGTLSIRHSTRNFPNREGSKPSDGQSASVALMDARSIAATAINGGIITPADSLDIDYSIPKYSFDDSSYNNRVYNGFGKADGSFELKFGPNIADWPAMPQLADDILVKAASIITDPVTTTDELIPSGETSSYRSNPIKLASFTLSRKDPAYVGRAKAAVANRLPEAVLNVMANLTINNVSDAGIGSVIYAVKPGDGSAREQAASCQKVLGGLANIASEYATKRYRSNLINWGMIPFILNSKQIPFGIDDYIFIPYIRSAITSKHAEICAYTIKDDGTYSEFILELPELTDDERQIILDGCLINYYRKQNARK